MARLTRRNWRKNANERLSWPSGMQQCYDSRGMLNRKTLSIFSALLLFKSVSSQKCGTPLHRSLPCHNSSRHPKSPPPKLSKKSHKRNSTSLSPTPRRHSKPGIAAKSQQVSTIIKKTKAHQAVPCPKKSPSINNNFDRIPIKLLHRLKNPTHKANCTMQKN